jgi:hypothetical protein
MAPPKSKKSVGLGNTLMNDRFGKGKGSDRKKGSAITRINHATGEEVKTSLYECFSLLILTFWVVYHKRPSRGRMG